MLFPGKDEVMQIQLITQILGKPPPEYIAAINRPATRAYVSSFDDNLVRKPLSEHPFFYGVDPVAIDLLEKIFVYDPTARITAAQAIQHPFFAEFHDPLDEPTTQYPFNDNFEELELTVREW